MPSPRSFGRRSSRSRGDPHRLRPAPRPGYLGRIAFLGVAMSFVTVVGVFVDLPWLPDLKAEAEDVVVREAQAPALVRKSLPICGSGRRVTCIVDGDTGWLDGEKWRLVGIDAPEASKPECAAEKRIGDQATRRLRDLMSGGYRIERDGEDRYGRALVGITLADGRDVGEVLIAEGLAQPWPNSGNVWCGR